MHTIKPADYTAVRREHREALQHEHVARLTVRLRSLSGSGASIEQARIVRDRYARAIFGYPAGIGGEAFADYLLSDEAGEEDAEDIDGRFVALERAQIDAASLGIATVRQAMTRLRRPNDAEHRG